MPPKRLSENPPPASSSSEEEEEEEEGSDEQNDSVADEQNDGVDKGEKDDDDEEEEAEAEAEAEAEEEEEKLLLLKKSTSISTPHKSGLGSDSDSESTQPSPSPSAFNIKFHKPNKSGSKRPFESDSVKEEPPASKRTNKGDDEDTKNKGAANQRLWSDDDEIAILKGLSQYKSEKGADPFTDMVAFHEFIKKSLHVDVSRNQLMDKIRRLKKKYQNNLERAAIGQDPVFSKPHDEKCFELLKKIWEENVKQSKKVSEEKQSSNYSGVTLGLASQAKGPEPRARKPMRAPIGEANSALKREENLLVNSKEEKAEIVKEFLWEKYPFLRESLEIEGLSEDVKVTLREQLGMIEKEKLKELEEKWKKLKQAELELFVQRMELVHEQVKLTLDSIK